MPTILDREAKGTYRKHTVVSVSKDTHKELKKFREKYPDVKQVGWLDKIILDAIQEETRKRELLEKPVQEGV